ncbi:Uncharacterized protein TCM_008815 [Theobroma cacao]|uniref:Uncharacterized protein n=1 Tax=Theobroma cacao TaxID=3641 RepID=A0A061E5D1_THECC|nr:Uncharacterized protein TCM_008815 [Theobroma cacao]
MLAGSGALSRYINLDLSWILNILFTGFQCLLFFHNHDRPITLSYLQSCFGWILALEFQWVQSSIFR